MGSRRLVGVEGARDSGQTKDGSNETSEMEQALARGDVGDFLRTEDTENFVLLMDGFAKISPFLLVPPATIGVSVLTLHPGRVLVVAILESQEHRQSLIHLHRRPIFFQGNTSYLKRISEFGLCSQNPGLRKRGARDGRAGCQLRQTPGEKSLGQHLAQVRIIGRLWNRQRHSLFSRIKCSQQSLGLGSKEGAVMFRQ